MCRGRRVNAIKNSFCQLNSVAVESGCSKMETALVSENGKTHGADKNKEKKVEFAYEISRANRRAVLIRQLCTAAELRLQDMQNFELSLRCV